MGPGSTLRGAGPGAMRAGVRADMAVASGGERRQHPRLSEPFPVLVRGVDAYGEALEINTVLDDFSAGGLYVRLRWRVERQREGRWGVGVQLTRHRFRP